MAALVMLLNLGVIDYSLIYYFMNPVLMKNLALLYAVLYHIYSTCSL